ncbi:Hypothetical predicted protein [Podarcis lilfordi]|uniref:Uncharacterized protein n=1 Tax=Podarcis lilfordi TaxID=74358 RepID=A0AA35KIF3_9SAUR|nr:Hypothetical predicted protein [Podarcis lilfordi]
MLKQMHIWSNEICETAGRVCVGLHESKTSFSLTSTSRTFMKQKIPLPDATENAKDDYLKAGAFTSIITMDQYPLLEKYTLAISI